MQVLEVGCIRVAEEEWHEGIAIINSIKVTAFHELLNIVLHNRGLVDSCSLSSSSVDANTISESENVLEALVLKSVRINIYNTLAVGNARVSKLLVRLTGRVNHCGEEIFLNDFA